MPGNANSGPPKGTVNNPNGRPAGTPNKITKKARELFIEIMDGEIQHIQKALSDIRKDNQIKYIECLAKLFQYTMPKQLDITSDGDKITDVNVTYTDEIRDNRESGTEGH